MAITEQNIVLLKSERLTDYADGGGRMTGNVIVDGQLNALFTDISDMDRTIGRVSLRKFYLGVQSVNADPYLGAHIIVTNPPADSRVNVTLFTTGSWTDTRAQARDRIESYSILGPESRWALYGDHIVGQKAARLFSISNAVSLTTSSATAPFDVGDVIALSTEKAGLPANIQYFRINKIVSLTTQRFTDANTNQDFYKDILVVELGSALLYNFPGATITRLSAHGSPTLVRSTQVADAARYFGVKPLAAAAAINDVRIKIDSPYAALVPSARAETPIVNASAGQTVANLVQCGAANSLTASASLSAVTGPDYAAQLFLGRGVLPGSLTLTVAGVAYKDNGSGVLVGPTGAAYSGSVDYASGAITLHNSIAWSATVSATATPAVAIYDNAYTASIPITISNRQFNYVLTLAPLSSPGSLSVDYRALGKWYRLTDNGKGQLVGATGVGSGSVDYAAGGVIVTVGAMPDVGSAVIFSWGTPQEYQQQVGVLSPPPPQIRTTLPQTPVASGSVTITWNDGTARSATANSVSGVFTGDASGTINFATGAVVLQPNVLPPAGTIFTIGYNKSTDGRTAVGGASALTVAVDANGVATLTIPNAPIQAGTLQISYTTTFDRAAPWASNAMVTSSARVLVDNGAGGFKGVTGGSINYTTGVVTFPTKFIRTYEAFFGQTYTATEVLPTGSTVNLQYGLPGTPTTLSTTVSVASLAIDLNTVSSDPLIANSVRFTFAGQTYIDRNGQLYRAQDPLTDSATLAGSIDYQSAIATLTNWTAGTNTLALVGMLTTKNAQYTIASYFRTPGAPLSPGSFAVRATAMDGTALTGTADVNGNITGAAMTGTIDWQSGVAAIKFGAKRLDSSLSAAAKAAAWYNAANVDAQGYIFVPISVQPSTIKFDAVLVSYINLDGNILGVDTVRLPQDGKVPIFRVGDVAVIHDTQTNTLPNPIVSGSTINLGRGNLAYARVYDATGKVLPTTEYTPNLTAGSITMAAAVNLTGMTQPLVCEHRIEDMSLVSDVDISGYITLMKPLTHAYTTSSYISSALVIGDMQARVDTVFDQQSWASVFSDMLSGNAATANYNNTLYPIAVTNIGAIEERWALVFTGATQFSCYGEYSGLIGVGNTATDFAPTNPSVNAPYFTLPALGWGSGWSAGNVLRFNTHAANYPVYAARTTLQGPPATTTDNFKLQARGNAN